MKISQDRPMSSEEFSVRKQDTSLGKNYSINILFALAYMVDGTPSILFESSILKEPLQFLNFQLIQEEQSVVGKSLRLANIIAAVSYLWKVIAGR